MARKTCTQCGKCQVLSAFYADVNQTDERKDECKACSVSRSIRYYRAHKQKILAFMRKYARTHKPLMRALRKRGRQRRYALVVQAKSKPCVDCGESFIPFVMDLGHVRGKKTIWFGGSRYAPSCGY